MSKPSSNAPRFSQTSPKPIASRIETPAQKVARLRAAHQAKRLAEISTWDKVVVRGRDIADAAHRWTVMGIVGISILMIGATTWTVADMVRYNRAKKKQFYETQSQLLKTRFMDALEAEGMGTATEDQLLLLQEERAAAAAVEVKKQKPGAFESMKNYVKRALDLNLSKEDISYLDKRRTILDRIEEHERKNKVEPVKATSVVPIEQDRPGPLDRLADEAITKAENTRKSWFSW